MTWRVDPQNKDLVYDGVELGIAPSPTKGTANLQNVNIATETGEAMASFARFKQDQVAITNGTLTASVSDGAVLLDAPATLQAGQWITVSSSTIPSATASANYLAVGGGGGGGGAQASEASGGGGGGGVLSGSTTFAVGSHAVVVGDGGTGGTEGVVGTNGENTTIGTQTAFDFWSLVVAGGGGGGSPGGNQAGGGGGAGGYQEDLTTPMTSGAYRITVGAGGAAGTNGSASSIVRIVGGTTIASAVGGGAGGFDDNAGSAGGSGGGGGASVGTPAGGAATAGQGNAGGTGFGSGTVGLKAGGGGGGAGAVGGNGSAGTGGTGGSGTASTISGASVTYAAGGNGNTGGSSTPGAAGTANRGNGGGGGGGNGPVAGGAGGSGVVILRFPTASITVMDSTGAASTTDGSDTILTWTTSGSFIFRVTSEIAAIGGGGGGTSNGTAGQAGGSGGGGGSGTVTSGGQGASGQGNDGGNGDEGAGTNEAGGGGGGAGAAGGNASTNGGNGGNGVSSSISGASVTYGGGGGGGSLNGSAGTGGTGGGGNGSGGAGQDPGNGTNGLGGGGGGGTQGELVGGNGGSGIVIISYTTGSMTATGGAITTSGGNTIHTFTTDGTFTVHSIATSGQYFVSYKDSNNKVKLSSIFDPYGLYPIAHGTSGTATFSTLTTVNQAISKATEKYNTDDSVEYRYYILDDNGYVWVYDSQVYETTLAANGVGEAWMLPDPTDYSAEEFNSISILNGWLVVLNNSEIQGKPTVDLGRAFAVFENDGNDFQLINPFPTHTNFANVGHQGKMHYCDGNYVGELFPTTSIATGTTNTQTYARVTGATTTATIAELISGSTPYALSGAGSLVRIPIVFFASQTGQVPAGIVQGTVYYAELSTTNNRQFSVYAAASGGSALTVTTVGSGTYINTFYPLGNQDNTAGSHVTLFQFSNQRLNLPVYETAQCLVEIGNTVLVGGKTNTIYPWNQISALPTDLIALPEADVKVMINVNNMAYVFAGNKGNVYITNNSSASAVLKVPDYCAGVPGTQLSYIEPKFTWGDAIYLRGRVYFSILDQTATKAGNCGGVWSFVPSQNFYYGQDTGIQLRLENQNSYGDYDGMALKLIANEEQDEVGPQYWAAWQDGYSEATSTAFGIDQSDDVPATTVVVETDLLKVGTYLDRKTFKQTEFVLTTPLASGDSVALYWRVNSTSAWTAFSTQVNDGANIISGYYPQDMQALQWLQIRGVLTTNGATTSSFCRFKEIRVR